MRVIVRDLNDATKFYIEDVEGHTPINYVCDCPAEIDSADGAFIDLVDGVPVVDQARKASTVQAKTQALEAAAARAYLAETDWYIIREMDIGVACPDEVRAARQAAREKI